MAKFRGFFAFEYTELVANLHLPSYGRRQYLFVSDFDGGKVSVAADRVFTLHRSDRPAVHFDGLEGRGRSVRQPECVVEPGQRHSVKGRFEICDLLTGGVEQNAFYRVVALRQEPDIQHHAAFPLLKNRNRCRPFLPGVREAEFDLSTGSTFRIIQNDSDDYFSNGQPITEEDFYGASSDGAADPSR